MVTACSNAERRVYSWAYDDADRVASFTSPDSATATTYEYDDTDQLKEATYAYQGNESYTYDENGNRTGSYQTGALNRMTTDAAGNTYQYDEEGNRTLKRSQNGLTEVRYGWDHRNRLVSVENWTNQSGTWVQGKTIGYSYDVFDRRVAKTIDNVPLGSINYREAYVYDGQNVALQFEAATSGNLGASSLSHAFLYGPAVDQILADQTTVYGAGWDTRWPLADNQGTIRDSVKFTPASGGNDDITEIVDHLAYDAFGKVTSQTNSAEQPRFTYTARELDSDTGLYYYRARWYDATTGKFMSEDPIDFTGGDENLYRYAANNPARYIDPSGMTIATRCPIDDFLKRQGVWREGQAGVTGGEYPYSYRDVPFTLPRSSPLKEVLIGMLASDTEFRVLGNSTAEAEKNLRKHIDARMAIVQRAKTLHGFSFPGGDTPLSEFTVSSASIGKYVSRPAAFTLNCTGAALVMMYAGILDTIGAKQFDANVAADSAAIKAALKSWQIIEPGQGEATHLLARRRVTSGREVPVFGDDLGYDWIPGDMGAIAPRQLNPILNPLIHASESLIYLGQQRWRGHLGMALDKEVLSARGWLAKVGSWSTDGKATTPTELWYPTVGLDMRSE